MRMNVDEAGKNKFTDYSNSAKFEGIMMDLLYVFVVMLVLVMVSEP